jgi:hypothetical protein
VNFFILFFSSRGDSWRKINGFTGNCHAKKATRTALPLMSGNLTWKKHLNRKDAKNAKKNSKLLSTQFHRTG